MSQYLFIVEKEEEKQMGREREDDNLRTKVATLNTHLVLCLTLLLKGAWLFLYGVVDV